MYKTASTFVSWWRSACWRRSGPESTRIEWVGVSIWMEERRRLFLVSVEVQVGQLQPMTGMPTEVEVPRKVMIIKLLNGLGLFFCFGWLSC